MEFMPRWAPLVVLAFLGALLGVILLGLGGVGAFVLRRPKLGRICMLAGTGGLGAYGAILFGLAWTSREVVLKPGEKKYFCEIDCHLAYSVEKTERVGGLNGTNASGVFYVVTLRTWFDPETTSTRRPSEAVLTPNARAVWILDAEGRSYPLSATGQAALERERGAQPPLDQPLRPGEAYTTQLAFEVPPTIREPRLFLTDPAPENRWLFGHERSPGHKKVLFELNATS